ncbi:MAG: amidohydrolase family protein [Ilumatobacteraceae bacterium]
MMRAFCADDRLLGVAWVPWSDLAETLAIATEALDEGCKAVMVPSAPGDLGPTHPDYHPLYAMLQERGIPLVTHIGGNGRSLKPAFHNNGIPVTDWIGGGGEPGGPRT